MSNIALFKARNKNSYAITAYQEEPILPENYDLLFIVQTEEYIKRAVITDFDIGRGNFTFIHHRLSPHLYSYLSNKIAEMQKLVTNETSLF